MTILPICMDCKHLIAGTLTCKAFPNGIPDEIMLMEFDHHKPYPGDNGIRFEEQPEKKDDLK